MLEHDHETLGFRLAAELADHGLATVQDADRAAA
jgi:hypothetical protein